MPDVRTEAVYQPVARRHRDGVGGGARHRPRAARAPDGRSSGREGIRGVVRHGPGARSRVVAGIADQLARVDGHRIARDAWRRAWLMIPPTRVSDPVRISGCRWRRSRTGRRGPCSPRPPTRRLPATTVPATIRMPPTAIASAPALRSSLRSLLDPGAVDGAAHSYGRPCPRRHRGPPRPGSWPGRGGSGPRSHRGSPRPRREDWRQRRFRRPRRSATRRAAGPSGRVPGRRRWGPSPSPAAPPGHIEGGHVEPDGRPEGLVIRHAASVGADQRDQGRLALLADEVVHRGHALGIGQAGVVGNWLAIAPSGMSEPAETAAATDDRSLAP